MSRKWLRFIAVCLVFMLSITTVYAEESTEESGSSEPSDEISASGEESEVTEAGNEIETQEIEYSDDVDESFGGELKTGGVCSGREFEIGRVRSGGEFEIGRVCSGREFGTE